MQMPEGSGERTLKPGPVDTAGVRPGDLDGLTIMRYAHIWRARESGGLEQYLRQLNRTLLERHRMTVIQTHLATDESSKEIRIEPVGLGRILWAPIGIRQTPWSLADLPVRVRYLHARTADRFRDLGKNRIEALHSTLRSMLRERAANLRYSPMILSDHLGDLLASHRIDLVVLHWTSYDTGTLVAESLRRGIPFVFINHFNNARFALPAVRRLLRDAEGIAAVSTHGLPEYLRGPCVDLSDAIDVAYFSPDAETQQVCDKENIILLPARIYEDKGQRDLLRAAQQLQAQGFEFTLCFAGATESEPYCQELRRLTDAMGLTKRVLFVGEKTVDEIRNWYAQSCVVVLPSYSEGLPRVLLEAQAMERPVVAYECGGIPQALLPGETGILVKLGDVDALARAIGSLLGNDQARKRMGRRGREFVLGKFTVAALTQRHEAFYVKAISRRTRRGDKASQKLGKFQSLDPS